MANEEKHFGNLAFIRGIVYYKLSPRELKTIGSFDGIANWVPRTMATILTWFPRELLPSVFLFFFLANKTAYGP